MSQPQHDKKSLMDHPDAAHELPILIDGVERTDWFPALREVKKAPEDFGLSLEFTIRCQGGFCKRHKRIAPIKYKTRDGFCLCRECGLIWATRRELGLKHGIDDL